jgi:hypothetical protein
MPHWRVVKIARLKGERSARTASSVKSLAMCLNDNIAPSAKLADCVARSYASRRRREHDFGLDWTFGFRPGYCALMVEAGVRR